MSLKQRVYKGEAESFKGLIVIGIAILAVVVTVLMAAKLLGEISWNTAP